MDRPEQALAEKVARHARGDPHVAAPERNREGVGRKVLAASLQVISQPGHHPERVVDLTFRVELAMENAVVHGVGMPCNVADQWHYRRPELLEYAAQLISGEAGLGTVEQRVIRPPLVAERVGDTLAQLYVLLEGWREEPEVGVLARLLPDWPCRRLCPCNVRHEVRGSLRACS